MCIRDSHGTDPLRDGAGKGQAAKLANQVSLGACMVGMADALAFAELSGLCLLYTSRCV